MKKTSQQQFDLMITFMEQHGDLNKPTTSARGKMSAMKNWDELTSLLNSDGSGDTKTTEKWKKVWSDFKNNTKKKAARLNKAAKGTGGGPAIYAKLSDLEQRVLNIVGTQAATGLPVDEAGFSQDWIGSEVQIDDVPGPNIQEVQSVIMLEVPQTGECTEALDEPGPSTRMHISHPPSRTEPIISAPRLHVDAEIQRTEALDEPGPSTRMHIPHPPSRTEPIISPPRLHVDAEIQRITPFPVTSPPHVAVAMPRPTLSGQTTPRRSERRTRPRVLPRGRVRPVHTDEAAQQFLSSDSEWRNFRMEQHRDYMDMRREQLRVRELELQTQREWQAVAYKIVNSIDKIVDKYCKE